MLTLPERLVFVLALCVSLVLAAFAVRRLMRIIGRGQGRPDLSLIPRRLLGVALKTGTFAPVFRARPVASLLHAFVGWAFLYYLLVNLGDVLQGFVPGLVFLGRGISGNVYRLIADALSLAALIGMLLLLARRFVLKDPALQTRGSTLLYPGARAGIARDSAVVGCFILLHVGARFLGDSLEIAATAPDAWRPFASALSMAWTGWSETALTVARHTAWWFALGTILAFIPYFPYSKHIHLFFAPLNFLLKPDRQSIGALDRLNFDDEKVEQFGASHLEHLSWTGLVDSFACIMCNRCQEACPAYLTGKVLSPAALEINKRYELNESGSRLAAGAPSRQPLTAFALSAEAVWACTACGACVDICPVNNEPMRDILEMRRHLVLMENAFPEQLQTAYRGMERTANPWNIGSEKRLEWAEGLRVPTVAEQPHPELLWWVGCAPATDARAQKTARAFAQVLHAAGVAFAVLGAEEKCTGDSARRSGNEYLFSQLAGANVATLNRVAPRRIVTTCPHCLHTLKNEYPAFGGEYEVIHHTQLIEELFAAGRLQAGQAEALTGVAFHDPCYLGRQNGVFEAPRQALAMAGATAGELPRNRAKSFCCGAGGAQMWKEEEHGTQRVSDQRLQEAVASGAITLAVGCPFCMIMLSDAARSAGDPLAVRDVAEIVAERLLPLSTPQASKLP